ncbi:MAG TPA: hypothetical protein VNK48_06985 [Xanthobacteraceae bacterium]|nr:hypothetical protein [Xanthobacteraceae bacterium]
MASVTNFIRNTPAASLRTYFDRAGIALPVRVNWEAPEPEVIRPLLRAVDEMDEMAKARVVNDAERVSAMADEAGQTAIYSVAQDPGLLDALQNGHDRALWVFLHDRAGFQRAEEVRYADERRRGRMWDGFIGEPKLVPQRDPAAVESFKAAVRERFRSNNVHVDIFDRIRPTFDGTDCALVQVTIYREGRPDDFLEFVNGTLDRRPRRPVFEAALTYEPATGVIEVVANDRESREDIVRLFARDLLATEFRQKRLPLRQFDLRVLQRQYAFPTDPSDGIESVRVNFLRLMPIDTVGERVTLECMRQATQTIWQMAQDRFGANNPLLGGWVITQAKLTIRFHPETGSRRGKTLPLIINMPHGCNLKDQTEREQMIGQKYLRRWGILRDV